MEIYKPAHEYFMEHKKGFALGVLVGLAGLVATGCGRETKGGEGESYEPYKQGTETEQVCIDPPKEKKWWELVKERKGLIQELTTETNGRK